MSLAEENTLTSVPVESSKSAISWGPIFGGAVAATGTSLILLLLGSGVGLSMVSPFANAGSSATTVGVTAAIWLVVVQWLSSGLGGYLTGRLRTKWAAVHTEEVFFRDTAHGFIGWALSTLFVVGFLASSITTLAGAAGSALETAASTAGSAVSAAAPAAPDLSTSYFTDALLRPQTPAGRPASNDANAAIEVSRILMQGAAKGEMPEGDKAYLASVVSARAGIPEADAKSRVDTVLKQIDDAKNAAKAAADKARKAAATTALIGAISLLVGAFIASAAAALGGRQRDEEEDILSVGKARFR